MNCSNHTEHVIRFALWMRERRTPVVLEDVMTHFEVGRATAYRYLQSWRAANGIADPPRGGCRHGREGAPA